MRLHSTASQHMLGDDALDSAGVIAVDVLCRSCRYNLRGLTREDKCPECGAVVYLSLGGWMLCFAPPGWIRRIGIGAAMCGAGTALVLIGPLVLLLNGERLLPFWIVVSLVVIGHVISSIGAFVFAAPEPSIRPASSGDIRSRSQTRGAMTLCNLLLLAGIGCLFLPMPLPFLGALLLAINCITTLAWMVIELDYASEIAGRLAQTSLPWLAQAAQACAVLCFLIFIIETMGVLLPFQNRLSTIARILIVMTMLGMTLPYIMVMLRLSRALLRESGVAVTMRNGVVAAV